jgi:Tfp pilus assembly protein PilF
MHSQFFSGIFIGRFIGIVWIVGSMALPGASLAGAQSQAAAALAPGDAPKKAAAAFNRGQQALQANDLHTAEAAFHEVLSLDPQAGAAYANLGVIAMRRKQWDDALAML